MVLAASRRGSGRLGAVFSLLILCALTFSTVNACAEDRGRSLLNAFDVNCLANSLSFATVDLIASHMHYPLRQNLGQSAEAGPFVHVRSWSLASATGPFELVATEGNGARGYFVACGVAAPDLQGEEIRTELMSALKLGPPSSVTVSADGTKRRSTWDKFEAASLVITDASPTGRTGVIVSYESLTPAKP